LRAAADDGGSGGRKKGQLAKDAGGAGAMLVAWLAKLALVGSMTALIMAFPRMPGLLRDFLLSEWALA
jgi:hypothetical protein